MQEQAVGNIANKDYLSMLDKLANYAYKGVMNCKLVVPCNNICIDD